MSNNLPRSFRQLIKPMEAVGYSSDESEKAFLSSIGGEDSEDDVPCEHCEREKAKNRRSSRSKADKVSQLRDSVRLHKPHGNEANNALRHAKLGRALHSRFELHGDPHDLDEAIAQLSTAMAILPPGHKHRPMYESNVGLLLCVRYEHTHAEKDLDRAITYCRHSLADLDAQPANSITAADKAWYQANLATALLHRYERQKQIQNLEESLTLWRTAISALPDDHPDKASYQSNLAAVYLARYQNTSNMEDLDRAIAAIRSAVRGTPQGDMHWAVYKYMASSLYHRRWTKSQRPEDIDKAIDAGRAALIALPSKHRYSSKYQAELAAKLLARYDQSGKLEDVNEAIDLSKDAAVTFAHSAYPAERSTTPMNRLVALSLALSKRFEKTDDMTDLDEAIKHARQAMQMADKSRSLDRHVLQFTLSTLIYTRFERLGKLEDLDESISHLTTAVDATPGSKSQVDREALSEKLSTLSSHHLTRFEFQRTPEDLDMAVDCAKTALNLKKAGDGDGHLNLSAHPAARYALALALFRRFEQNGDMKDLDGALKNAQLAYDAVATPPPLARRSSGSHAKAHAKSQAPEPEADSRKVLYQSLLSGVLCARYKRLGNRADLDAAIAHAEAILKATPPDHPLYDMYKSIHSFALLAAAPEETGITPDDAIGHAREEAERAKEARDPSWGLQILRLCNLLYARYEKNLDAKEAEGNGSVVDDLDLEHALQDWRRVATAGLRTVPSPPSVRFRAALKWADVSCREGKYKSAVEGYKVAMALAPRVALARLKGAIEEPAGMADAAPGEENELLLNTFSLASDCAAAAIERGQIEAAIEFLEQSRSLIWRDALGIPSELDSLHKVNPTLADHVVEVLLNDEQMAAGVGPMASPASPLVKPNMRPPWMNAKEEKLRAEGTPDDKWKSMVGTVRASEPGFADFMRPWSLDSMREEGATLPVGPVIILNSSYLRCDAIILASTSEPMVVPLTKVTKGDLERLAAQLVTGVKRLGEGETTGFEFDKAFLEPVLKELWDNAVQPVMKKLDELAVGGGRTVGWISTGAFTWLPMHAAATVGESIGKRKEADEDETAVHSRVEHGSKYSFYYATTLQSLLRPPTIDNSSESRVLIISDQPPRRTSLLAGDVTSIHALKSQLKGHKENNSDDGHGAKNPDIHIESLEAAAADEILRALNPPPTLSVMEDEPSTSTEVDTIHFASPIFCDALRPSNSSWRVVDGAVIRISDLFNSWFFYSPSSKGTSSVPRLVFSSTTSYRLEGPTRSGTAAEGKIRLPQELMSPEAALQFAGVRGVIGQIWNTKSEDATTIANHVYGAAVNAGSGEDKRIFTHPITGRITKRPSVGGNETPASQRAGAVWDTRGFEEGLAALRAAHVPLFRTVPFVRYGL